MASEHPKVYLVEPRIQYVADGFTNSFYYPFVAFQEQDIEVYINNQKMEDGYVVEGVGASQGGRVIFNDSITSGGLITILRNIKAERVVDFQESSELRAKCLNDELDRITAGLQQSACEFGRTVRLSPVDMTPPAGLQLPAPGDRANKWLAFDSEGNVTVSDAPANMGTGAYWGSITGNLGEQTDLAAALESKASAGHDHDSQYLAVSHAGTGGAVHPIATPTMAGFLSASDKEKLDNVQYGAQINPPRATSAEIAGGSSNHHERVTSIDDIVSIAQAFGGGEGSVIYYVSPTDVGGGGAGDIPVSSLPATIGVRVQSDGRTIAERPAINFVASSNASISVYDDNTNNRVDVVIGGADLSGLRDQERTLQFSWTGKPAAGSSRMLMGIPGRTFRLAAGLSGGADLVGATQEVASMDADFTVDISTDSGATWNNIGTLRFAAGVRAPTIVSGFSSDVDIQGRHCIMIKAPVAQDATIEDIVISINGRIII